MGRLSGKVAIITGGASGMGEAASRLFVQEGANIVIGDLQEQKAIALAAGLGNAAVAKRVDVSRADDVRLLVDTALTKFGRLDVMFNNAGIGGGEGFIHETPEEVFDRIVAVDLKAVWLGIKYAVPAMLRKGRGSIVNTASVSALMGIKYQGAYGAAKGGVVQLTRVAAIEYAEHGIRVNAILPGGVLTPLVYANPAFAQPLDPQVMEAQLAQVQPIRRAGMPVDIANAALWLASDESSFVTGASIVVDGGWTASARAPEQMMELTRKSE
jgi:NAD(P)-dependent dehydrogenase (short-subunit alcohol dehydrogenase family)